MTSLVEQWAAQIRWQIAKNNIIVEGTSDVELLTNASDVYAKAHGRKLLDSDLAVLASGERDDGGVDGVNRRLNLVLQLADADRDPIGRKKHRFVGLFDNDRAGRSAIDAACLFDRRLIKYSDLFLLHPVMPPTSNSASSVIAQTLANQNRKFAKLDWEVEDMCSESLLAQFEDAHPQSIIRKDVRGGLTHRKFDRSAKPVLRRFVLQKGSLEDYKRMIAMLKAMRSYLDLDYKHIAD